jgi:hypothetical protein
LHSNNEDQLDPRWYGAVIGRDHWHFHRRLFERYGIILAPGEYSKMKADIKNGTAQVIKQKSPAQAIYVFKLESANQPVFVAAVGTRLTTAMPPSRHLWLLRKKSATC